LRRGEVWWANLPHPAGRRPVLLLSRNEAYLVRSLLTVAPISTRVRGIPVEVELGIEDGLPKRCAANLDSLVTIPKASLEKRLATLSEAKLRAAADAIRFALDLEPPWARP
jgi:mRNA interferase MazF